MQTRSPVLSTNIQRYSVCMVKTNEILSTLIIQTDTYDPLLKMSLRTTGALFTNHSQEYSSSFLQDFVNLEEIKVLIG